MYGRNAVDLEQWHVKAVNLIRAVNRHDVYILSPHLNALAIGPKDTANDAIVASGYTAEDYVVGSLEVLKEELGRGVEAVFCANQLALHVPDVGRSTLKVREELIQLVGYLTGR